MFNVHTVHCTDAKCCTVARFHVAHCFWHISNGSAVEVPLYTVTALRMLAQRQVSLCLLLVLTGVTSFVTIPVRRDYGTRSKDGAEWASKQQRQLTFQHHPSRDGRHLSITKIGATTNANTNDIPSNVKLLILPGFGNVMGDYILSSNPDDPCDTSTTCRTGSLLQSFINRGWKYNDNIFILPIRQRYEWIQVFLYGLFDIQFLLFSNAPPTNPAFLWYLQKIKTVIQEQMLHSNPSTSGNNIEKDDNRQAATAPTDIILIGHSAGGWLGRAAIAYLLHQQQQQHNSFTVSSDRNYIIRGLVTLGAPNLPPPITAMDMTRGALRYTDTNYPGAYQHYSNRTTSMTPISRSSNAAIANTIENSTIFYITVCGNSVQGQKKEDSTALLATTSSSSSKASAPSTQIARFAYNSYEAVCGDGTTLGDGVVPLCSAHLQNAIQITLPNIYHSINVPEQWYGTDTVFAFDVWYNRMMEQLHGKL